MKVSKLLVVVLAMSLTLASCDFIKSKLGKAGTPNYKEAVEAFLAQKPNAVALNNNFEDDHMLYYLERDASASTTGDDKYTTEVNIVNLDTKEIFHKALPAEVKASHIVAYKSNSNGDITLICENNNKPSGTVTFNTRTQMFDAVQVAEVPATEVRPSHHSDPVVAPAREIPYDYNYLVTDPGRTNVRSGASSSTPVYSSVYKGDYFRGYPSSESASWIYIEDGPGAGGYIFYTKVKRIR